MRTEVSISTIDISLFGSLVKTMTMTPKPGRGAGWVEQLYLDDDLRISAGNKGSVFVHVKDDDGRENQEGEGGDDEDEVATLAIAKVN